eukprot:7341347-Ditylum_brightwellii.AAC.1
MKEGGETGVETKTGSIGFGTNQEHASKLPLGTIEVATVTPNSVKTLIDITESENSSSRKTSKRRCD